VVAHLGSSAALVPLGVSAGSVVIASDPAVAPSGTSVSMPPLSFAILRT
jgi:hypothetical protein